MKTLNNYINEFLKPDNIINTNNIQLSPEEIEDEIFTCFPANQKLVAKHFLQLINYYNDCANKYGDDDELTQEWVEDNFKTIEDAAKNGQIMISMINNFVREENRKWKKYFDDALDYVKGDRLAEQIENLRKIIYMYITNKLD